MGAPTAKLETVVIISPYKVLGLFFNILALICFLITMPTSFWFHADKITRYGLWHECIIIENSLSKNIYLKNIEYSNKKLNLGENLIHKGLNQTGKLACSLHNKVWVQICGSFVIVSFCCTVIGLVLIALGFTHKLRQEKKMKYYGTAAFVFVVGVICVLTALVLFPTMFIKELNERGKDRWYFGWSYGVAWGSVFFLIGAAILLLCDRKREEIFYKESLYINQDEEDIIDNQENKIKTLR